MKLGEKEKEFKSQLDRIKLERNEKVIAIQQLNEDLAIANDQLDQLRKKTKDQQDSHDALQAQALQQHTTMCQEADERISQLCQEAQNTLQSTQDKVATLERENQTLLSRLEKAHTNEETMKKVEVSLSGEKHRLQEEMTKLSSAIQAKDLEISQIRADADDENRKIIAQYGNDIEDYKSRLSETSAKLKELEVKAILWENLNQAKISAAPTVVESELLDVEAERRHGLERAKDQDASSKRHDNHDTSQSLFSSQPDQNARAPKARKKVNRENQSVIEATQTQIDGLQFPGLIHDELSQTQVVDPDLFATFLRDPHDVPRLQEDRDYFSALNYTFDSVPETQDPGALPLSQQFFTERLGQAAEKDPERNSSSSTDFSTVTSEELAQMQKEVELNSTSKVRGHECVSANAKQSSVTMTPGPLHADGISVGSSCSSQHQERPRSQANTASRMMPPPSNIPSQSQSPVASRVIRIKLPSNREKLGSIIQGFDKSVPSEKRKLPTSETNRRTTSKKQRKPVSPMSAVPSPGSPKYSPGPSTGFIAGSRSRGSGKSNAKSTPTKPTRGRPQGSTSKIHSGVPTLVSSDATYPSLQLRFSPTNSASSKRPLSRVTRSNSKRHT